MIPDRAGRATFRVKGRGQKIDVVFGGKFIAGEIYSPAESEFVCFEPMTAIDNGLNLAHRGVYKELRMTPPGELAEAAISSAARQKGFPAIFGVRYRNASGVKGLPISRILSRGWMPEAKITVPFSISQRRDRWPEWFQSSGVQPAKGLYQRSWTG